jgi:hypothetical protein
MTFKRNDASAYVASMVERKKNDYWVATSVIGDGTRMEPTRRQCTIKANNLTHGFRGEMACQRMYRMT